MEEHRRTKMRKLTILITVLCMASATQAVASGRYQAVGCATNVCTFVVDTKTGKVKFCKVAGCTALSDK